MFSAGILYLYSLIAGQLATPGPRSPTPSQSVFHQAHLKDVGVEVEPARYFFQPPTTYEVCRHLKRALAGLQLTQFILDLWSWARYCIFLDAGQSSGYRGCCRSGPTRTNERSSLLS